jgi:hypothetical protein
MYCLIIQVYVATKFTPLVITIHVKLVYTWLLFLIYLPNLDIILILQCTALLK